MLIENIDSLILNSMKEKNSDRVKVLRLIKTELVKKEKDCKKLDSVIESSVLLKQISQREDSINQFKQANRIDLVESEEKELEIIKEFAPKQVSEEEIVAETERVISTLGTITMKDMKNILSEVQKKYPTANGKIVSQIVKNHV